MLPTKPRLLKFMELSQSSTQEKQQLSPAAQALIIFSLVAGSEVQETSQCTALTVRRKEIMFFVRVPKRSQNR